MLESRTNSDEAIFQRAMASHGGVYRPLPAYFQLEQDIIRGWLAGALAFHDKIMLEPNPPANRQQPVHFDFVDNSELQAYAFGAEGREFIGIYSGCIEIICELFTRLMCHPLVFTNVGDPSVEVAPPLIPFLMTNAAEWRIVGQNEGDFRRAIRMPNNKVRGDYAWLLTRIAIDFLVAHEFAHLSQGHIEYLKHQSGIPFIPEMRWSGHAGLTKLDTQGLEVMADRGAASDAVLTVINRLSGRSPVTDDWALFYQDPKIAFATAYFAICFFLRILGDDAGSIDVVKNLDHPPTRFRQFFVAEAMASKILDFGAPISPEDFMLLAGGTSFQVEVCVSLLTGAPRQVSGWEEVDSVQGQEHLQQLTSLCTNDLLPKLRQFSRARQSHPPKEAP